MLRAAILSGCEKMRRPALWRTCSPRRPLACPATQSRCAPACRSFLFHTTVVSRWLVIPIAARSPAFSRASPIASRNHFLRALPDFFRIVLHPSRLRINLPVFLLRASHDLSCGVEHHEPRARRSLINGSDVMAHSAFPSVLAILFLVWSIARSRTARPQITEYVNAGNPYTVA